MRKTTMLTFALSVMLGFVGMTVIGCGEDAPETVPVSEADEDPGAALGGTGMPDE